MLKTCWLGYRRIQNTKKMRAKSGARGPFAERMFLPIPRIERLCEEALRSVGLYPDNPSAVRIERFIEKKFGLTPEYDELPAGVLGYTAFGPSGPTGMVVDRGLADADSTVAQRRISTTLAHEAGHCLFHAHFFAESHRSGILFDADDQTTVPKILCRDEPLPSYDGKWWEYQANAAIGALLLPRDLVLTAAQPFLEPRGLLGLPSLPNAMRRSAEVVISGTFDVNPIVARIRLGDMFPTEGEPTL
jgi:hypothetical protein